MLGKLMKYEFRATSRWILPLFGGVLFLAIINKIFITLFGSDLNFGSNNDLVYSFSSIAFFLTITLYILVIVATCLGTCGLMIRRFQSNLMGDEGYLMFTLPVTTHQHLLAKLLTSSLWVLASLFVTFCSVLILSMGSFWGEFSRGFGSMLSQIPSGDAFHLVGISIELILMLLVSIPSFFLVFYLAVAFAYTRQKNKLLYGFGAFLVINFVTQVITTLIILIINVIFYQSATGSVLFGGSFMVDPTNSAATFHTFTMPYFHTLMIVSLLVTIGISVALYFATHHLLTKKLNME